MQAAVPKGTCGFFFFHANLFPAVRLCRQRQRNKARRAIGNRILFPIPASYAFMEEELSFNERFAHLSAERQRELIAGHCRDAERLILTAPSRKEADRLSAEACDRFAVECPSTLVRTALRQKLHDIIERRWNDARKRNVDHA